MNGQLSELPLAELVHEISLKGLSGTLRLQHEGVKAAVYVDAGEIIYAASNLRELRLAEYLRKQGLVSEQQLSNLSSNRSDASQASALCANGLIDRGTVDALFTRQVGDILRVTLLWTKGTWEFDDRSLLGDSVRVTLDIPGLLMEAARRMRWEYVASRFPDADELISPVTDLPDFNALLPTEGFVLSRVDRPITFSQLIALSGLGELEATRTIYGFILGGFVERERQSSALQVKPVRYPADARSDLAQRAREAEPLSFDQSSEPRQEVDLEGFLARLDGASNHYEVLNITPTAASQHIKNSYYALARLYHPDKFHLQATSTLHARIESAFARITQAYETLTDSRRRSGYDAKLAALEKSRQFAQSAPKKASKEPERADAVDGRDAMFGRSESDRAENNFKDGYASLQQGQTKLAVTKLAAAARAFPQEARYRAYYGRALALGEETRRLAEAEILAAVKLDPNNASYRIMLAELCYDLGFFRRAEGEIERAMALDPNNPEARKLLSKLEATRTTR